MKAAFLDLGDTKKWHYFAENTTHTLCGKQLVGWEIAFGKKFPSPGLFISLLDECPLCAKEWLNIPLITSQELQEQRALAKMMPDGLDKSLVNSTLDMLEGYTNNG